MTMTREEVERLLAGATPGKRVQFHGSYCKEAEGTPFTDWDTSHEMSVIRPDGSRYRLAHYKHAADAYLSQMAPDLARAFLATMTELEQVKGERDEALAGQFAIRIEWDTAEDYATQNADKIIYAWRAEQGDVWTGEWALDRNDKWVPAEAVKYIRADLARAETTAAETALAAMTEREGVLRAALDAAMTHTPHPTPADGGTGAK